MGSWANSTRGWVAMLCVNSLSAVVACSVFVDTDGLDNHPGGGSGGDAALEGSADASLGYESGLVDLDGGNDARPSSKYRDLILSDGPIAYWRMGVKSGSFVPDETGRANQLVAQGSAIKFGGAGAIAGDTDTAVQFPEDLSDSTFLLAEDLSPFAFSNGHPFSIEFWAKYVPLTGAQLGLGVFGAGATGVGYSGVVHGGVYSGFHMDYGDGGDYLEGFAFHEDAYTHVVATYDGTTISYYLDGTLQASTLAKGIIPPPTSGRFEIGASYCGFIDEFAIYDKALTLAQVARHHDVGTTP